MEVKGIQRNREETGDRERRNGTAHDSDDAYDATCNLIGQWRGPHPKL